MTQTSLPSRTNFSRAIFTRDQESAADLFGMRWALEAGYSYKEAMAAFRQAFEPISEVVENQWFRQCLRG